MFDFSTESIIAFLYALPGVLFALSIHEFSHGYVANKLGDPTAKNMGRLTLSPIKHIDIIGLIAMFVVGVGWAKPVPVNTRCFRKPRRDMALTALAGPISNIVSAFLGMCLYYVVIYVVYFTKVKISQEIISGIFSIIQSFIFLNIGLAIFNLIPIPPLDGSRILDAFLPPKALLAYHKYEDIIRLVLLGLLIFDFVSISPVIQFVYGIMAVPIDFIFGQILNLLVR